VKNTVKWQIIEYWSKVQDAIDNMPRQPNYKGHKEIMSIYSPKSCVGKIENMIDVKNLLKEK